MTWGPYFDETYWGPTPEEQQEQLRNDLFQAALSQDLGFAEPMDLTAADWLEQIDLARMNNDLSALAGTERSAPGVGYMFESPESAQQNALQNAWMDALAQRMSTPNFDPRYAQTTTSFSPQFGGVYVDPFVNEQTGQEQGFIQDLARISRVAPEEPSKKLGPVGGQGFARDLPFQYIPPPVQPEITKPSGVPKYFEKQEKRARQQRTEQRAIRSEARAVSKEERERRADIREREKEIRRRNALGREAGQIEKSVGTLDARGTMRKQLKTLGFAPGTWQFREQVVKILEERDRLNAEGKNGTIIVMKQLQEWVDEEKKKKAKR